MPMLRRTALALLLGLAACAQPMTEESGAPSVQAVEPGAIRQAVDAPWRSAAHRARDAWRHPVESLQFWGLKPGMTVVEIDPGGEAWWTEILAPYAKATGGRYVAGYVDLGAPTVSDAAKKARTDFQAKFGDSERFGAVQTVNFGFTSGLQMDAASADLILVARAFHNWGRQKRTEDRKSV